MRSRFSAYAAHNADYLLATWDTNTRPQHVEFSKEEDLAWERLDILSKKKGQIKDHRGIVEFKAHYKTDGQSYALHEISRFVKRNGRWYYLDGVVKSVGQSTAQSTQSRNAPCPCGSGKKYKRCCGA